MIQVRRKETNLLVQNAWCENKTQGRPPSCRAVESWECTPHGCDDHTVRWCNFRCGPASACSTQPGTTETAEPPFLDWVATRCRAPHERLHLPFSGHRSPKAPCQSPVVPPSPGCRSAPSATPEREKLVNRPINTKQIESRTWDVGDKWMSRTFKAQWAESSTHTSLI